MFKDGLAVTVPTLFCVLAELDEVSEPVFTEIY